MYILKKTRSCVKFIFPKNCLKLWFCDFQALLAQNPLFKIFLQLDSRSVHFTCEYKSTKPPQCISGCIFAQAHYCSALCNKNKSSPLCANHYKHRSYTFSPLATALRSFFIKSPQIKVLLVLMLSLKVKTTIFPCTPYKWLPPFVGLKQHLWNNAAEYNFLFTNNAFAWIFLALFLKGFRKRTFAQYA